MDTYVETENCDEKELGNKAKLLTCERSDKGCTEEFANYEPGSGFAVVIFTYIGIVFGLLISTEINGFLIGRYNVGKCIVWLIVTITGFKFGKFIKYLIDKS